MSARRRQTGGGSDPATDLWEYHRVGLRQARVAFYTGMVFAALGALVVLAGAVKLLFFGDGDAVQADAYTTICGAIAEAVAALLLMQADRANRRMMELFDRGRHDRDLTAAQRIAERLPDDDVGVQLRAWLVLHLAGDVDPGKSTRAVLRDQSPSSVREVGAPWRGGR